MKNITIYILLLCSSLSSLAQNAPIWTSTDACVDSYTGSITIEFDHDLVEFPLPYEASYYNSTTGDYEEIIITSSPFTVSDLSPGEYELEVFISDKDIMEFCAEVYVLEIEVDYEITQACPDNGSITLYPSEGQEPYKYIWDDGSTDQIKSNLSAGKHYATVTDINGCKKEISLELTEEPAINLDDMEYTIDHAECNNNPNLVKKGFINIYQPPSGGTQPFTYTWSHGTTGTYINNLVVGIYTVDISDAAGCVVSMEFEIEEEGLPIIEDVEIINTCSGASTGYISIDGLYTTYEYKWSTGSTDSYIADLPAGTYSVTITDGCSIERTYEIINDESGEFAVTSISSENSCIGENTGSVSLTYENNVGRVYAFWDDGDVHSTSLSTITRNNMSAGSYTVTLEDECGREVTESYVVEDNTLDYYIDMEPSCYGNTILTLNIVDGLYPPYTYSWSGGETESQIEARSELDLSNSDQWNYNDTYYSLTITDGSGCEYITSDILLEHIEYTIEDVLPSCEGFDDGEFKVIIDNEDLNFSAFINDAPIGFSNIGGQLEHHASNLAPGTYRVVLEFDNCNLGFSVTIEDSIERIYDDHIEGDEDDEDDLGTCIYQFVCKDITISEDVITEAATLGNAVDNSDNLIVSSFTNIPAIFGVLNPLSWFGGNPLLNLTDKCGYEIMCDDEVVGFHELGNTKISGAAYDIVLQTLGSNIPQNQYAECQDIFYCEATLEVFGEEEAFGWLDGVVQGDGPCYQVDCNNNVDDEFCLDDILPDIFYGGTNPISFSTCKPRNTNIITLLEHLDRIKNEFPDAVYDEGGLIPLLDELALEYPTSGCGYILYCENTLRVLNYNATNNLDCPLVPLDFKELYEEMGYQMPSTFCDYAITPDGEQLFLCECQKSPHILENPFDEEFCIHWISPHSHYPFGLQSDEDPTTKKVRKIKPGKNQLGFTFKNFSNRRNTSSTFPQLITEHANSPFDVYMNEVSNKVNVTFDNQDMNFKLDVISGSYEVNESKSYLLYRTSNNRQHFTLSSTEHVKIKGVTNNNEGRLLYYGTYSGTLSIGSQSIKNGSHFIGKWNENSRRTYLYNIPNSDNSRTKLYCNSNGTFAVNRIDNQVEIYSVSNEEQLERKTFSLDNIQKQMNIKFVSDKQLILSSDDSNSLKFCSLTEMKQSTYDLKGDYHIINKTVSQNDIYSDISISYQGYINVNGIKLSSGTNSSFVILRFNNNFQLIGYYFDDRLSCATTIKETITYSDNNIVIGGNYISDSFKNVIGNSEYYNSGINISTPFKALIYDELFTDLVESRNINHISNSSISLFPNPTKAKVSVLTEGAKMKAITVYNTSGQALLSVKNINESKFNLDVTSIKSGIYFLEIDLFKTSETMKLIIIE